MHRQKAAIQPQRNKSTLSNPKSTTRRALTTRTKATRKVKAQNTTTTTNPAHTAFTSITTPTPVLTTSYLQPKSIQSTLTTATTRRHFSQSFTPHNHENDNNNKNKNPFALKPHSKPLATHFISLSPMSLIPKSIMKRTLLIHTTFNRLFSTENNNNKNNDDDDKRTKPTPSEASSEPKSTHSGTPTSQTESTIKDKQTIVDEENKKKKEKEEKAEEKSKWSSIPKLDTTKLRKPDTDPEKGLIKALRIFVGLILALQLTWVGSKIHNMMGESVSYQHILANYISQHKITSVSLLSKRVMFQTNENEKIFHDVLSIPDFAAKFALDTQRFGLQIPIEVLSLPEQGAPWILLVVLLQLAGLPPLLSKTKGVLPDRSGPKISKVSNLSTRFKDVAGMDEAKNEIVEFVEFLREPEKFSKLGARLPKGALLSGPPGTGKTLLAKATAGEAGVSFYTVSGSEFQQMYVGMGAKKVRDLFKTARKNAPAIIFIDEIDSIAKQRSARGNDSSSEREATLNQLLVEMDGFNTQEAVVVFAATNRAETLDEAVTRAGRFDRKIAVSAPDLKGREEVFNVHLTNLQLAHPQSDVAKKIAALTPGMVGADIANVCNEAAIGAARRENKLVELIDFETAVDKIVGGLEKKAHMQNQRQRKIVAHHEAGHALMGWFLEHTDPLLKVTIVPRANGALGFAQYLPKEGELLTTQHLRDMVAMALGGRAAEDLVYGKVSTGASDDLKQVSNIVQGMITSYGMSKKFPNTAFRTLDQEGGVWKSISQKTHFAIDQEVGEIVQFEYERAKALLTEKRDLLDKLGEELLKRETLNHDDIVAVLGERPFKSDSYVQYVKSRHEFDQDLEVEKKQHEKKNEGDGEKKEEKKDEGQKEGEEKKK